MYTVLRNHLGTIGGHYRPIHNLNTKMTEISQNGQNGQVNYDVYAIGYTYLDLQMPRKGSICAK